MEDSHRMPEKQSDIIFNKISEHRTFLAQGLAQNSKGGSNYLLFENF